MIHFKLVKGIIQFYLYDKCTVKNDITLSYLKSNTSTPLQLKFQPSRENTNLYIPT